MEKKCYKCYQHRFALSSRKLRVYFSYFFVLPFCYRKCYWKKTATF